MSERILVVDDDEDIVRVVRINLELEGYEVATAHDGQEALDEAAGRANQALSDYNAFFE